MDKEIKNVTIAEIEKSSKAKITFEEVPRIIVITVLLGFALCAVVANQIEAQGMCMDDLRNIDNWQKIVYGIRFPGLY